MVRNILHNNTLRPSGKKGAFCMTADVFAFRTKAQSKDLEK
jgi:hypothetical protein